MAEVTSYFTPVSTTLNAAMVLYGYSIPGTDGGFNLYNGSAAFTAGISITVYKRTGDAAGKTVFFSPGITFDKGLVFENVDAGTIRLFYQNLPS